jgi:hypothetical protein
LKTLKLAVLYFALLLIPKNTAAQEITGTVRSKSSTIYFEDFGTETIRFNGEIRSNLSGSKYTVRLKNGKNELEGEITDKLSKINVNLSYKGKKIEGEIKRSTNNTKDQWDIEFLGHSLEGIVVYNAMGTASTYDFKYDANTVSGKIHKNLNTLVYDLALSEKKVSGKMSYNVSAVKHTYSLSAEDLSEDDIVLLLFMESNKLINEHIADIDDFQGNDF